MTDRLDLLHTFQRIAARGRISAAAEELGISQASASRRLADLERLVGAVLIRRTTHDFALTAEGEALLPEARELTGGWDAIVERHAQDGPPRGTLSVIAPVALGQTLLVPSLARLMREAPGLSIGWTLEDGSVRLSQTGADCWIKVGPVPDDRLVVRTLGRAERIVVAAPDLATDDPAALEAVPFLALAPFEGDRIVLHGSGGEVALTLAPRLTTTNIVALHEMVRAGAGWAVLPRWLVAEDLAAGRLAQAVPDYAAPTLPIHAAFHAAAQRGRALSAFLDRITADLAAAPGIAPA